MNAIELKELIKNEMEDPINLLVILSDLKISSPYEYNVIENFFVSCKKWREYIKGCEKEIKKWKNTIAV